MSLLRNLLTLGGLLGTPRIFHRPQAAIHTPAEPKRDVKIVGAKEAKAFRKKPRIYAEKGSIYRRLTMVEIYGKKKGVNNRKRLERAAREKAGVK